ncbi:DUF6443 domain-containing protein [Pedobacter cryoconitis]|uniref:RHS repeat-associated protein n=1 Tax=Pedobacter cryoconitis TaxID=188932 RepID=A0A7X0MJQ1_9SPHI|nr:DUF6443 domain-containing protein [Pedobacter cryoconitis]MBB6499698.1 RHS repeat-associated protein [Pedobacter cryoconitis]
MRRYLYSPALIFCALFLGIHSSKGQMPKDTTLNAYTNQTEIKAVRSITLLPGFTIPAGKTVRIFTGINFDNWVALSSKPSTDQNYILARVFRRPDIKTDAAASSNSYNTAEVNQSIQYFDGLGRPMQTVIIQGSPGFADVVQPVTYDAFGREDKKYQPYAITSNGGAYRSDALTGLTAFYATPTAGIAATGYPYGQTVFEPSPLNRVVEQGAPGADWQPVSGSNTGHTQKIEYGTNAADDVKLWTITTTGASGTTNYGVGKLYKTTSKDENWKAADLKAGSTDEYKNFDGLVILKRVWETDTKSLSTYYVYDDLGNLRYVLPPAVNENGQSNISSFAESDDVFKQFIYGYHYDGRRRLVEKQVPGKDWEYLVYNSLDQVVLTQDANGGAAKQWIFTKYDALGRVVISGLYTKDIKRAALQDLVTAQKVLWENRIASGDIGYDNLSFPLASDISSYYVINYYDDYSFPLVGTFGQPSGNQMGAERTKSLMTGTRITTLGTSNMLLSVYYYDGEGRLVQTKRENHLGGTDIVDNAYNFAGELTESTRNHTIKGQAATVIANRYFYDHIGRKIATSESINGQPEIVLNKLDYTETGQVVTKQLHSTDNGGSYLQTITYGYNERGWLNKSASDLFNMQLKYNEGDKPQWNGNISKQLWGRAKDNLDNNFIYSYDKLNRLTDATSTNLAEIISYDVNGNIKTLTRNGLLNTYSGYTGNQLTKITGFTNSAYGYDANGNLNNDSEKNIKLTYNYLNLPQTITGSQNLSYTYDAAGNKLKKTGGSVTTDYIGGIQHKGDGTIDIITTEEGLVRNNGGIYSYEYTLTDHLGNNRATFYKNPSASIEVLQKDDYFAFGLRKAVLTASNDNKYLYNGKELQDELGQYDYGARFYDPVIGRWTSVDPLAEKSRRFSPYTYVENNPIRNIDPDGMATYPIITITNQVIGRTKQTVAGYSSRYSNNSKVATTTINVYRAVVTDTEDASFHMEFGVTRAGYAVTKSDYSNAYKENGNGDGPRTATNVGFVPAVGSSKTYDAEPVQVAGLPALKLTQNGSDKLPSADRSAAVEAEVPGAHTNYVTGEEMHVGGYYVTPNGNTNVAMAYGCFGVVNPNNSSSNPSNSTVTSVVNSIVNQANNSQTDPGKIQVVVQGTSSDPTRKTVTP